MRNNTPVEIEIEQICMIYGPPGRELSGVFESGKHFEKIDLLKNGWVSIEADGARQMISPSMVKWALPFNSPLYDPTDNVIHYRTPEKFDDPEPV